MGGNTVFIDSGAFIALADESDEHHAAAKVFAASLSEADDLMTTEMILAETASFLNNHLGKHAARKFWAQVMDGDAGVRLEWTGPADLRRAWRIGELYADQSFSLVDCVSFAVIERLRISRAFAFDKHFRVFRPSRGSLTRLP